MPQVLPHSKEQDCMQGRFGLGMASRPYEARCASGHAAEGLRQRSHSCPRTHRIGSAGSCLRVAVVHVRGRLAVGRRARREDQVLELVDLEFRGFAFQSPDTRTLDRASRPTAVRPARPATATCNTSAWARARRLQHRLRIEATHVLLCALGQPHLLLHPGPARVALSLCSPRAGP